MLKAGLVTEKKRVAFTIETDDAERQVLSLYLAARFVAEWELQVDDGSRYSLPARESREQRIRVIARRQGEHGRPLPASVSATGGLTARFDGPAVETREQDDLVILEQKLLLQYPSSSSPGSRAAELRFLWADGRSESIPIRWDVRPVITIQPASLVLRSSAGMARRTVTIRSDERPFRVTKVHGQLLQAPPALSSDPATAVDITLVLDPAHSTPGKACDVVFETDHPTQKTVTLTVLVVEGTQGATP